MVTDFFAPPRLLSDRQLEVLRLVADGCSNQVIARRLCVSPNTVKTRLRVIYRVLGVNERAHAVAVAMRAGEIR